ncbi:extracellular solute-binding protein [Salipaludibacillus daqingensis]|uniref:extracellular solute-binding protein n=1 Tax=Salipaludibacillus daqingensis TaxID=3041001 RepID=UPI002474599A|nr:extracellular solute-binding protein [Salipaludibacillus daqingensis]
MKVKKNLVLLLSLSTLLAACTGESDGEGNSNATNESSGNEIPEVLEVWANDEASQLEAVEVLAEEFTEETGIEVEVTPFGMLDQTEAISLDGPSGQGPDLFFQPGVGDLSIQGLVQPIMVDEDDLQDYTESSLEALKYEGELYGLPLVVETYAMFYNQDLIEEAPSTIEELEIIAEEHTDSSVDQYGFLYDAGNFYFDYAFLGGYGGYVFGQDEEGIFDIYDIGLDNDGAIQGGELIQSWFDKGYLPIGVDGDIVGGLFSQGSVAAVFDGPWAISDYRDALGESLGVAPLPKLNNDEEPTSFIGVKGWMLSEYSENPEWASKLALHLTSEESAQYYYNQTGEMPPYEALLEGGDIADDPLASGFGEQIIYGEPMPNVAELSHVWDPMADAGQFISQGEDVREVLEEAVEVIESEIRLARGE